MAETITPVVHGGRARWGVALVLHAVGATVTAARDSIIMQVKVADLGKASADCRSKFDRAFIGILVERLNLANTRLTSG